jgi:hypothetical protein
VGALSDGIAALPNTIPFFLVFSVNSSDFFPIFSDLFGMCCKDKSLGGLCDCGNKIGGNRGSDLLVKAVTSAASP